MSETPQPPLPTEEEASQKALIEKKDKKDHKKDKKKKKRHHKAEEDLDLSLYEDVDEEKLQRDIELLKQG